MLHFYYILFVNTLTMAESPTDNLGTPYMALGWALTGLVVLAVSLRIYSRIFITRSFGSDDVAILFSMVRHFSRDFSSDPYKI